MLQQNGVTVQYLIDPRASQFTVQAFASGLISSIAHSPKIAIRDWEGRVSFEPDTLRDAKLRVVVKVSSLDVLDELRDSDRRELSRVMNREVLETEQYPQVVFESATVTTERLKETLHRVNIVGKLDLHGVVNSHSFSGQVAFGVDSFRAYGEFTVLQSDYGIRIASIAGGTLKLQDQLKFTYYVVARKNN